MFKWSKKERKTNGEPPNNKHLNGEHLLLKIILHKTGVSNNSPSLKIIGDNHLLLRFLASRINIQLLLKPIIIISTMRTRHNPHNLILSKFKVLQLRFLQPRLLQPRPLLLIWQTYLLKLQ
jgi:hypothetical protein